MLGKILIASTEAAADKVLIIDNLNLNGSLSIIGLVTTEVVAIEIPKTTAPIVGTDADWTPFVYDGITYVLNVDNNRISLPFRGTYRIAKPASSGNAFGIRFE